LRTKRKINKLITRQALGRGKEVKYEARVYSKRLYSGDQNKERRGDKYIKSSPGSYEEGNRNEFRRMNVKFFVNR